MVPVRPVGGYRESQWFAYRRLGADSCAFFPQVIVKKNESYDAEDMQI